MKSKKKIAIGLLCMALVFMGLGYSLFSTTLNITGSSQSSGTFDVKITNVEVDENNTTSGATNTMYPIGANYAVTETTLSAEFNAPGDYITYDITVTNRGSIDAVISVETNMLDETDAFELSCTVQEGTEVLANNHITFPCRMKFKDDVDNLSNIETANMSVSLKAVQKATYTPPQSESDDLWTIVQTSEVNGTKYGTLTKYNTNHPDASNSVTVPYSYNGIVVKKIDGTAFSNANSTVYANSSTGDFAIIIDATGEEYNAIRDGWLNVTDSNATFYSDESLIPQEYELYGYFNYDVEHNSIAPDSKTITSIDFSQATELEEIGTTLLMYSPVSSINFGSNSHIKVIGTGAFAYCNLSGTLTIPSSVETIGDAAFTGDYSYSTNQITTLMFESGSHLKTIGRSAFEYNVLTATLTIPSSVETIEAYAFLGESDGSTNQISTLVFESGSHLQTIGEGAFKSNALAGTLTIPSSVTSIRSRAFYSNQIEIVHLGSNIEVIGYDVFTANTLNNSNTLTDIYVDMTKSSWNNTVVNDDDPPVAITSTTWHDNGTAVHFNQS